MKRLLVAVAVAVSAAILGGVAASQVGAAGASAHAKKTVVITTRKLPKLGTILVDSKGHTLYMFPPDKHKKVTCVGTCAASWPPVKLPKGAKAVAAGGAKASLISSDPDPDGGRVVTYAGWPLYTYVADTKPGTAVGQGLNVNGGLWFVLSPSGKVIKTKP